MTLENLRNIGLTIPPGEAKYERIADAIERAIVSGQLASGERLPAIRDLSHQLGVSAATAVAAYTVLRDRGLISGHVGRGTFVAVSSRQASRRKPAATAPHTAPLLPPAIQPWRKRTLYVSERRLRAHHPEAIDCARGHPDSRLIPLAAIRDAWRRAIDETNAEDLQYPVHDEPDHLLVAEVLKRLDRDAISADPSRLVAASSAQQFVSLAIQVFISAHSGEPLAAVEEPGHHSAMDALEQAGCRLFGVAVDSDGIVPEALDAALSRGARMLVCTPRAHSPTSASWTPQRRLELAAVLEAYPDVFVVEDDHFGEIARARPGSLLNDEGVGDRVLYVRSFSKALAPDLRLAVGVCGERVAETIRGAKYAADGWTSHLTQRVVARLLADRDVTAALAAMTDAYARRRTAMAASIGADSGARCEPGSDGLHVWVRLPRGCDASEVIARAAALGALAAPGEPFFVKPGNGGAIRVSAGAVSEKQATAAGEILGRAIRESTGAATVAITV